MSDPFAPDHNFQKQDGIDYNRGNSVVMLYMKAEVRGGVVKVFPAVHGLYDSWHAAMKAKVNMRNPDDYTIVSGYWRKS